MIKALGRLGGRRLMILGLSGENVTRLGAGEPILIDGDQVGYSGRIMICYGRVEQDIVHELHRYGLASGTIPCDAAPSAAILACHHHPDRQHRCHLDLGHRGDHQCICHTRFVLASDLRVGDG